MAQEARKEALRAAFSYYASRPARVLSSCQASPSMDGCRLQRMLVILGAGATGAALALARLMAPPPLPARTTSNVQQEEANTGHTDALQLLSRLTRCQQPRGTSSADEELYEVVLPARRALSGAEMDSFARDGFVCCPGWFSAEEVELLRGTIEQDSTASGSYITVADTEGRDTKLTEWHRFGSDTFSQFGRSASLVRAASELMKCSEPFLSHAKLLLKEPHSGGAWEWHQDFGYWYDQGLLQPDKIVNAIIAVDRNTEENGCMRLLSRSHSLGRIEHGKFGGQMCANPTLVAHAMALPGFKLRRLTMEPGDVAFMHSNTLHASAPNVSDDWRRNMIIAYNSKDNEPLPGAPPGQPPYRAIDVVPDESILRCGVRQLDAVVNDVVTQSELKF